ncbi:EamA family transporter [Paucibacter soli]|uniref:EamA family transporter n=1 Tax=Paucibacter soli TaxID=3133433 RepID=UPI00309BE674
MAAFADFREVFQGDLERRPLRAIASLNIVSDWISGTPMDIKLFLVAQISPIAYAVTNIVDKRLLSTYFSEGGVSTLLIFSSLLSAIVIPCAYAMDPTVFTMSPGNIGGMVLVAVINVLLLWAYLRALSQDDPTTVVIFYQMVPVLSLGVGYVLLHEIVTLKQGLAMIVIMLGTGIASFDLRMGSRGFKRKTVGFMLIACSCWAAETVVFKMVALDARVWPSLFWTSVAHVALGMAVFSCSTTSRRSFLEKFRDQRKGIITLCVLNETLYVVGNTMIYIVAMETVVALVALMQTFQAVYLFLFEALIVAVSLRRRRAMGGRRALAQKALALIISGAGTTLLFS